MYFLGERMKRIAAAALLLMTLPGISIAGPTIVEGAPAKADFAAAKDKTKIIGQKDKTFTATEPGKPLVADAKALTVAIGEKIFITNDEEKYVHNIYDLTDDSWVLKKQAPGETASIAFDKPGVHKLGCAIHPQMLIEVTVK
jgi:plastocyanin